MNASVNDSDGASDLRRPLGGDWKLRESENDGGRSESERNGAEGIESGNESGGELRKPGRRE